MVRKCSICRKRGHDKRAHKKQKGGGILDVARATGNVLQAVGRADRERRDRERGAEIVGAVIGATVFLAVKGTQKVIELSKDASEKIINMTKEIPETMRQTTKYHDQLDEIRKLENKNLSLTESALLESRKRKLLNKLRPKRDSSKRLDYLDKI